MSTQMVCPICDDPIRSGQGTNELADGSRAHATCADTRRTLDDPHVSIDRIREVVALELADAAIETRRTIEQLIDGRIADAIAAATRDAIPNKSTALRRLMIHAADRLDSGVQIEAERTYPEAKVIVAMVEAATVLRTIAVYVSDDEGPQ